MGPRETVLRAPRVNIEPARPPGWKEVGDLGYLDAMDMRLALPLAVISTMTTLVGGADAAEDPPRYVDNPYQAQPSGPVVLDLSPEAVAERRARPVKPEIPFSDLDKFRSDQEPEPDLLRARPGLPEGWVQIGDEVVPAAVAEGAEVRARPQAHRLSEGDGADAQPALVDDICAFPDQVPPGIYTGNFLPGAEYPRRGTIYLNFVGADLINGNGENSAEDYSVLALTNHHYPAFTGGEAKALAVIQAVEKDFTQWAIRVVYEKRPHKTIPWVMTMVGGKYTDTTSGPAGGVAPSADCEDYGMRNVCFSFTNGQPVNHQANVIGQEIGHTYGLAHTYGSDRIMAYGYNTQSSADLIFGDDCADVLTAPDQAGGCGGVNKCHCGDADLQNDKATISAIYAPPGPDNVEPTIEITGPADGATYPSGATIGVNVDVWDDFGGYGWKLMVYSEGELLGEAYDYDRITQFSLSSLPDGVYELVAEIEDQADHIVQDRVTVYLGVEPMSSGTDAGTDAGTAGTDAGTDAGTAGTAGTAASDASGSDSDASAGSGPGVDDEEGCSCRSDQGPPPAAALALLLAFGWRRRRSA